MTKFVFGIITGIVLATVGFNGLANLGNRAVNTIQNAAESANH